MSAAETSTPDEGSPRVRAALPDEGVRAETVSLLPPAREARFARFTEALRGRTNLYVLAAAAALFFVLREPEPWLVGAAVVAIAGAFFSWRRSKVAQERIPTLLVGSPASLQTLREELRFYGIERYVLVGSVTPDPWKEGKERGLGTLADLRSIVQEHDVKLVLMSSRASRMEIFDAMARDCDDLDLDLCDLSEFYEDTFRYTPIAEINSAWFSSILHPGFRAPSYRLKRLFDLAFAVIVGALLLPVIAVLAWIIRRDGGPALFSQVRIGEGGKPFRVYKLRTMSIRSAEEVSWSSGADPRVTRIGRWLRKLHVDEFPQLWNILRGEMSVVGPRPEQPAIVARLEDEFRFYRRRHMVRPGLAGWAQARCGYAGSDEGVAWKLSHDLYYVKRRSLRFDLVVLVASLWESVAGNQFREPRLTPVVVGEAHEPVIRRAPVQEPTLDKTLELEVSHHL
jgi:lipopolysaccharide/colanic/teichoic acid biosynthesis glycosyltransferase